MMTQLGLPEPAVPTPNEFGANVEAAQMVDVEIESFKEKIRALQTRRNTLVLIAQLPPELLSTVFRFLQARSPYVYPRSNGKEWTRVSHVCTHWRRVALECPDLWSNIDFSSHCSFNFVEAFLERSKRAPLVLSASITPHSQAEVQSILTDMGRMRRISLSPQTQLNDLLLDILETHPAPLLERFELSCVVDKGASRPLTRLFGGTHPSLRELKLIRCNLSWDLPPLGALVDLFIGTSIPQESGQCPSIVQLASILRNAPNLEKLYIHGDMLPSSTDTVIGSSILLPCLSKISFQFRICQCTDLLDHISYPATSSISIKSSGMTSETPTDTLGIMRHTFNNSERLIGVRLPIQYLRITFPPYASSGLLHIEAWNNPGSCEDEPLAVPQISLGIVISMDNGVFLTGPSRIMFWDILPLEGLHTLSIAESNFQKPIWLELCGRLGRLTILKLNALGNDSATSILGVLSSAHTISQRHDQEHCVKPPPLYFPSLRELSVSEWDFETLPFGNGQTSKLLKQLITCLTMRKEQGAGIKVMDIQECRHLLESGVEELRNVVPQVSWDMLEGMTESEDDEEDEYDDEDEYEDGYYGHSYWGRRPYRGFHY